MAAALIIGGIAAGASIYASKKASSAAKQATTQQVESADKALALQKELYEQTRTDLAPYREQGQQGLMALSSFLLRPPGRAQASGPPSAAAKGLAAGFQGTPIGPGQPTPYSMARNSAPALPPTPAASGGAMPGGPPPGMVAMRSPSGQLGYVPQARVPDALAAGGQVVR